MSTDLKSKLSKSFSSQKFQLFLVFLVLSFVLLVLTKFSKTYTEKIQLDVEYQNLPEDIAITIDEPMEVDVEVRTVGFRILAYYFKNKTINLDMAEDVVLQDSSYLYIPDANDRKITNRLGNEVEILSVKPDSLIIPFSILNTKKVPIIINSEITLASGFDYVDQLKSSPDSVNLIGPNSVLGDISFIETENIQLEDISKSTKQRINLVKPENAQVKLGESSTEVVVDVSKFTEGTVQVPITIQNLPKNLKINYFPKTVSVSFYVSLDNFSKIKPEDFEVVCDYSQIKNSNKSFFVPILKTKPDLVRTARIKQDKVEFITTK